ncbi:hypothetical protein [Soonwooa purpurea]
MSTTNGTLSVNMATLGTGATTNYNYYAAEVGKTPANSNDGASAPFSLQDNRYTIFNQVRYTSSWAASIWQSTLGDHTGGGTIGSGRMFVVNASNTAGEFYRRTLTNIVQGAPINASLWIMNIDTNIAANNGRNLPNITVKFMQGTTTLYSYNTGNIPREALGSPSAWKFFKNPAIFIPTSNANIDLVLVNNAPGGAGNDLAIDDIIVYQSFCDFDNDGIPNYLDLDSDGDGCPDVIEGGANFTSGASYITNNALNTTVNSSGVPAVPSATPAITGYNQTIGQTVNQAYTVNPAAVAGTVGSNQTIVSGSAPSALSLTGSTGTIQWQSSTDNVTFANISGATSASYSPGTMTSTTYYRAVVSSLGGCSVNTNSVVITVVPNTDSDGDEVVDYYDLDDDNDGILDTDEGFCLSTPLLIESKTFSATGSGAAGRPNITFSAPTTGTGKRLMFLTLTIERDHTSTLYGDNWESTLPATDNFANAPVVKFGSNNMTASAYNTSFKSSPSISHSDATISVTQYVYTLWDSQISAGLNSIDLSNFQLPKNAGDEWHAEILVFDHVNNLEYIGSQRSILATNDLSISGNMLANSQPAGTIEQNNVLLAFGATSAQSGMSINSGWNTITSNSVANTNGTYATDPNTSSDLPENDGISVFTATKTGVTGNQTAAFSFNKSMPTAIMYRLIPYPCNLRDTDGDGIPDYLDLDSDADGCPDAKEGEGNFNPTATASGTLSSQTPNINFGTTVDANGVPTEVGASGQAIGQSIDASKNDCISFVCPPDPYAAQQTWWLPYRWPSGSAVKIDFQSGSAVLNNPVAGTFGQGNITSYEGNTAVTNPITGALIFVTDGNKVFRGSDGLQATGFVGGNDSAGEAAAVIPDANGVLGRDFIIFGNASGNTAGPLRSAKYNAETNVLSGITTLLSGSAIYEALEVIPHTNGVDYWILVNTTDQKLKSYLYTKASGFNSTPVSSTDVANLSGVDPTYIAVSSFISWDPRNSGKLLIARHNKIGLANFNPSTGALGTWDVKVTQNTGIVKSDEMTGYSAALSPNGRYIYYVPSLSGTIRYHDTTTGNDYSIGTIGSQGAGLKVAKDGRLYIVGYDSGLYYFTTPDTPPTNNPTALLPVFYTGGRGVSLQLPNNVYWGCITCQSGTAAPVLASTNITSNPATVGDLIALLSASNKPAGTVITIHSGATATDANKLANSTAIVAGTTYYISFYDGLAVCYSPTISIKIGETFCYKPAATDAGNTYPSKHGITALGRAGTDSDNWPMVRQSAWTVLEAKTKGFVINRVKFNTSNQPVADNGTTLVITDPVEGMMVYDTTNNCLKVYTTTDGTTFAWHCMTTQACPN